MTHAVARPGDEDVSVARARPLCRAHGIYAPCGATAIMPPVPMTRTPLEHPPVPKGNTLRFLRSDNPHTGTSQPRRRDPAPRAATRRTSERPDLVSPTPSPLTPPPPRRARVLGAAGHRMRSLASFSSSACPANNASNQGGGATGKLLLLALLGRSLRDEGGRACSRRRARPRQARRTQQSGARAGGAGDAGGS